MCIRDRYAHCVELLEALEIGDAVKADCKVEKIDSFYTCLLYTSDLKRRNLVRRDMPYLELLDSFLPAQFAGGLIRLRAEGQTLSLIHI